MLGLKVKKEKGEKAKRKLIDKNALDKTHAIKELADSLIIPIKHEIDIKEGELIESEFERKENREGIKERLEDKLNEEELDKIPSSYDIIGDILILELEDVLKDKKEIIGNAFLNRFKNSNVVAMKKGPVTGEYRIQKVEVIAGEDRTETLHKENGCKFKVDINKVFYTPRMSRERAIVSEKVEDGEKVVDMFAGVGPFSIPIAKKNDVEVIAIEKNEDGYNYLKKNIKLNDVGDKVKAYLGDCREVVKKEEIEDADRIIMNLPQSSEKFLDLAKRISREGTVIHFYWFLDEEDLYNKAVNKVKGVFNSVYILDKRTCGQIAPRRYRICIDFKLL